MSEWIKAIILGIVEGITEFLPISSTGHLIVTSALLDFQGSLGGTFEIFIQLGAVIAVMGYYRAELIQHARAVPTDRRIQGFWVGVFVAFLPAAAVGFLLKDWIKEVLFSPLVVAVSLIVGGLIFLIIERFQSSPPTVPDADFVASITWRQVLWIGLAQITALIPGVSRSGASIIGGMLAGLHRKDATRFSFYLAIPTLGAATIYDLLTSLDQISTENLGLLLVGTAVSCVVAWFSIGWLLRYVSSRNFVPFGIYRIAAGIIILLLIAAQIV